MIDVKEKIFSLKSSPQVSLVESTKLSNIVIGARTCWQSFHKGGNYASSTNDISDADKQLLNRLLYKYRHESVFEHVVYTFRIIGISRAVLQELARHRHISLSVRSSRYTLKELRVEAPFRSLLDDASRAEKYVYFTGNVAVDGASLWALENLRALVSEEISNDIAKFALPESYKTDLVLTCNLRELRHVLNLRLDKTALWAFRELARAMYDEIPEEHLFLFENVKDKLTLD